MLPISAILSPMTANASVNVQSPIGGASIVLQPVRPHRHEVGQNQLDLAVVVLDHFAAVGVDQSDQLAVQ